MKHKFLTLFLALAGMIASFAVSGPASAEVTLKFGVYATDSR